LAVRREVQVPKVHRVQSVLREQQVLKEFKGQQVQEVLQDLRVALDLLVLRAHKEQ
jgi:hypothetical protein